MFDSHCHPTDIENPVLVVETAAKAGVHSILACGYNAQSNEAVVKLRQQLPGLPIAVGLHPWFASEPFDTIAKLIFGADPIAIGECGLDGIANGTMPSVAQQRKVFETQLDIAQRAKLPVTVHSRRAVTSVFETIGHFHDVRGVMHAFGGSYEQAKLFVERGWLIGVGGAITRGNAHRIHRVARCLPLEGMVLETDAPAIGLDGVCAADVRPAHLPLIAVALSHLRAIDVAEIIGATDNNVKRMFGCAVVQSAETT
jgi:TatD DNase family protein